MNPVILGVILVLLVCILGPLYAAIASPYKPPKKQKTEEEYAKAASSDLPSIASEHYAKWSGRIPKEKIKELIIRDAICSELEAASALDLVAEYIKFCIAHIHECDTKKLKSEEPVRQALTTAYPNLSSSAIDGLYKYSDRCVAKGA